MSLAREKEESHTDGEGAVEQAGLIMFTLIPYSRLSSSHPWVARAIRFCHRYETTRSRLLLRGLEGALTCRGKPGTIVQGFKAKTIIMYVALSFTFSVPDFLDLHHLYAKVWSTSLVMLMLPSLP